MDEKLKELVKILSEERGSPCQAVQSGMPDAGEGMVYGIFPVDGPQHTLGSHVRIKGDGELEWARWSISKQRYTRGRHIDLEELRASGAARPDVDPPPSWVEALEAFRRAFCAVPADDAGYGMIVEASLRTGARVNWCAGILRRLRPELSREQARYQSGVLRVQRSLAESDELWGAAQKLLLEAGVDVEMISWRKGGR